MTYTEVHANFCEQQITVRRVLVLSDTVDTIVEGLSLSSVVTVITRVLLDVYSAGLKCTPSHLSVEGEKRKRGCLAKRLSSYIIRCLK